MSSCAMMMSHSTRCFFVWIGGLSSRTLVYSFLNNERPPKTKTHKKGHTNFYIFTTKNLRRNKKNNERKKTHEMKEGTKKKKRKKKARTSERESVLSLSLPGLCAR